MLWFTSKAIVILLIRKENGAYRILKYEYCSDFHWRPNIFASHKPAPHLEMKQHYVSMRILMESFGLVLVMLQCHPKHSIDF